MPGMTQSTIGLGFIISCRIYLGFRISTWQMLFSIMVNDLSVEDECRNLLMFADDMTLSVSVMVNIYDPWERAVKKNQRRQEERKLYVPEF